MRHDQSRKQLLVLLLLGASAFLFVDLDPAQTAVANFLSGGPPAEAAPTVVEQAPAGLLPRRPTAQLQRARIYEVLRGMVRGELELPHGWSVQRLAMPLVGARY
jgi:hypothetical protein